jgi:3-oxoadipate enol-lactonase
MTTIKERSIETDGRRLAWLEAGAGWPVILLHAFPLNADMWRPQLAAAPDGWRFIAPDLRGFGQTPLPKRDQVPAEPSLDDYASDVCCLMDALEIDGAVIGGLSMGGYVTFAVFRRAASRFGGMILADTRPQADTAQGRAGRVRLRAVLEREGASGVAEQMLPKLLSDRTRRERPDVVDRTRRIAVSNGSRGLDAALVAMMNRPDSTADLERISCGTLVIVGQEDAVTPPADATSMQRAIPRSTLAVIAGAGHLSNIDQPDAFSKGVADFLVARL